MTSASQSEPSAATSTHTIVRLEGRDVLDVLHRISASFLIDLAPSHARMALFCDFRGRLLHRAAVAVTSDGAVWLVRDDAPGSELAAFVDRHVFREDLRIMQDARQRVRLVLGDTQATPGTITERDGSPARITISPGAAFAIDASSEPAATELERIRAGWPRHGHEISDAFTPFETGLAYEVHLSKGCYTGQEALLRLMTYSSVRRRLALVEGEGAPPAVPADVRQDNERAGVLTSAAQDGTRWIGLAVLAHAAVECETPLTVGDKTIDKVTGFPLAHPLGLP